MLGRTKIGYIYSFVKTRKDHMVDKGVGRRGRPRMLCYPPPVRHACNLPIPDISATATARQISHQHLRYGGGNDGQPGALNRSTSTPPPPSPPPFFFWQGWKPYQLNPFALYPKLPIKQKLPMRKMCLFRMC